jgi:CSLREA domain-containing protein
VQLCTFTSNSASVSSVSPPPVPGVASGGAISNVSGGTNAHLRISNSTFNQNTATGGTNTGTTLSNTGSSGAASATIEIGNTIFVAANPVISNSGGIVSSDGYNMTTGGADGIFIATGDQINTDAHLRELASNGGSTQTHALSITSPAVDKGKRDAVPALAVTTDQRGVSRPQLIPGFQPAPGGDRSDIGAFEVAPYIVTTIADHDDGTCNAADCTLREAIIAANGLPDFTARTFDTICFAQGVSGTINLTGALPNLSSNMEIVGPGANILTVRRNTGGNYRIFSIPSDVFSLDVTISGLTLTNGYADPNTPDPNSGFGGCIYVNTQTLHINKCVLTGNNAYSGGAIFNTGGDTITVSDSTISNNTGTQEAGAVANTFGGSIAFSNVTFAGNSSPNASVILNVSSASFSTIFFRNCTLGDNSAGLYGIYNEQKGAVINLRNTILSTGAPGGNIFNGSSVVSLGNNISSDAAGGDASTGPGGYLNKPGDMRNTDPKLDPAGLQDNGGPTPTIALLAQSPAINAGTAEGAPPLDQRGFGRIGPVDIGAFEFQGTVVPPTPTPTPTATPTATPSGVANLSSRVRVGTGDNVLIGGFIVTGPGTKRLVIRAIGPSLPVDGRLANPQLQIYDHDSKLIAANDDWGDSPDRQAIIDSGLAPSHPAESAVMQIVQEGAYTAIVSGVGGGTGLGLVELYDLDQGNGTKLADISTRGLVQTGDDVVIGGFYVSGSNPLKVVVRAIGPSLPFPNKLADPLLEVFDSNGVPLALNNNWRDTQEAQIMQTGIAPSNDLEAAAVLNLGAGPYTVVIRGVNGTTGVGVVEVYALD